MDRVAKMAAKAAVALEGSMLREKAGYRFEKKAVRKLPERRSHDAASPGKGCEKAAQKLKNAEVKLHIQR